MAEFEQKDEKIQSNEESDKLAKIEVIGVGGGGGNAVKRMIEANLQGVEFYVVNTDLQALRLCANAIQIQIGEGVTHGLGAGANPELGRLSAEEDKEKLEDIVKEANMVFVTAGMGGGTGTGASPIIAGLAREAGALTVSVVTRPFTFEGRKRARQAEEGIEELKSYSDAQIVIPNQRLIDVVEHKTSIKDAFLIADEVLLYGVKGISDLINTSGEINVDFADVRAVMKDAGLTLMGIGRTSGDERAKTAAERAISCPLLDEISIEGATDMLVNVTASSDVLLSEVYEAMDVVNSAAGENADVNFGLVYDDEMGEDFQVTVIAVGFGNEEIEPIKGTKSLDIGDFVSNNFIRRNVTQQRHTEKKSRRQSRSYGATQQSRQNQNREHNSPTVEDALDVPPFLRVRSRGK